jgi:ribosomal protein S18 acetylase RimI-like enzyme
MDTPIEDLAFEDALKELELIVGKLESGDTPLQQAIELYEKLGFEKYGTEIHAMKIGEKYIDEDMMVKFI